jgi:spermidine/putrescine transport system ATP-binding protein
MEKVLVRLENVSKKFDKNYVIKDFSLDIYEGEFLTLLGPSGCGKTTVLRMISGLESVTKGKVFIDSVDVTNVDATKREVNTIFQNLALFPKMTVTENISFGLRMKKLPKEEINKKVREVIKLVKLDGLENRLPAELSGGQQQRVAIARGIVMNPKVLLLDESLCSLDLKLKKSMQVELKKIQKKLGITFIYVTHAQDEALSMSDRIVIINNGKIEQIDTPENIYRHPNTIFVADFIGEANILDAKVINKNTISINDRYVINLKNNLDYSKNETIKLLVRPENVNIYKSERKGIIHGVVNTITYSGDSTKLTIVVDDKLSINAKIIDENMYKESDVVSLDFDENFIVPLRS